MAGDGGVLLSDIPALLADASDNTHAGVPVCVCVCVCVFVFVGG